MIPEDQENNTYTMVSFAVCICTKNRDEGFSLATTFDWYYCYFSCKYFCFSILSNIAVIKQNLIEKKDGS